MTYYVTYLCRRRRRVRYADVADRQKRVSSEQQQFTCADKSRQ